MALDGSFPFYNPKGRRRALWATVEINGRGYLAGSLRNHSFDSEKNRIHAAEVLRYIGGRDAILGGDFNAWQGSPPMRLFQTSGRFSGELAGPFTFPAERPDRCLDYLLAPAAWRLVEHHVVASTISDHRAVVSTFLLQEGDGGPQ